LYQYKRRNGFSSWEDAVSGLLAAEEKAEVVA
jgi:hypothetical protein